MLDIATGTGIAADAAAVIVGSTGHIVAADISPAMLEGARRRTFGRLNLSLSGEDGQALTRSDMEFDVVLCHFGLMFFADPVRGLSEFYRVLRPGGRAVVSVCAPHQMHLLSHYYQAQSGAGADPLTVMLTSIGDRTQLKQLFEQAGFLDIEVVSEKCSVPSLLIEAVTVSGNREDERKMRLGKKLYKSDLQCGLGGSNVEVWFVSGSRFQKKSNFGPLGGAKWGSL